MAWPSNETFMDFVARVQLGLIPNVSRISGFGRYPGLTSGNVPADIWPNGGQYPWITAPGVATLTSSSPADAVGGAGLATVQVNGLDGITRAPRSEVVTLVGTGNAVTVATWARINSLVGLLPGVANAEVANVGAVSASVGGTVRSIMPIGDGMSQGIQYSTPADSLALIYNLDVQMIGTPGNSGKNVDCALWFRNAVSGQIYRRPRRLSSVNLAGLTNLTPLTLIGIPAGFDFQVRALAFDSATPTEVDAAFEGLLFSNLSLRPF